MGDDAPGPISELDQRREDLARQLVAVRRELADASEQQGGLARLRIEDELRTLQAEVRQLAQRLEDLVKEADVVEERVLLRRAELKALKALAGPGSSDG